MLRTSTLIFAAVPLLAVNLALADSAIPGGETNELRPVPFHGHPLRGAASTPAPSGSTAAMTFHGGNVVLHPQVRVVFAGPQWTNPVFAGDKMTGLDAFFAGYSGSAYGRVGDEYIGANGPVGDLVTYQGREPTPQAATVDGNNTNQVLASVCQAAASSHFQADTSGNQVILLYSDSKRPSSAKYCGYHGAATCLGQPVTYSFVWNLDGDVGCDPQDKVTTHSQGLAAIANITAHELAEIRTDPGLNAWFDSTGNEIGDKCAWQYSSTPPLFTNGTRWKLQALWSNADYALGAVSHNGCISGASQAQVTVPNVVGATQAAATTGIVNATLVLGTVTAQVSSSLPKGIVIGEVPVAGTSRAPGTAVNLIVSSGKPVTVPNAIGTLQASANAALLGAGLGVNIGQVATCRAAVGVVVNQLPVAGTVVAAGSTIALAVASLPPPVTVPNLKGLSSTTVNQYLGLSLSIGTVTQQSSSIYPPGTIISVSPSGGTSVPACSKLNLVVASGTVQPLVPSAAGSTSVQGGRKSRQN